MIRLTCTHCKTDLELDDAFAGGVCRCQHCGTIQTVPSHLKDSAGTPHPQQAAAASVKSKSLYKGRPVGGGGNGVAGVPSSGLDDLASAVASSGLVGSGLTGPSSRAGPNSSGGAERRTDSSRAGKPAASRAGAAQTIDYRTPQAKPRSSAKLVLLLVGAVIMLLVGAAAAVLFMRDRTPTPPIAISPSVAVPSVGNPGSFASISGPHFLNVPLESQRVVLVIDRGDASKAVLDPLKGQLYKSLESLGPDRQFQVIFWKRSTDAGMEDTSFPASGMARATPQQIADCRKKFEDLTASGATEIDEAIRAAMARRPDEIVIATAKGGLLEETFITAVDQARGSINVKIHTVALGGAGASKVLQTVAQKTGGTYTEVSEQDLRAQ